MLLPSCTYEGACVLFDCPWAWLWIQIATDLGRTIARQFLHIPRYTYPSQELLRVGEPLSSLLLLQVPAWHAATASDDLDEDVDADDGEDDDCSDDDVADDFKEGGVEGGEV